VSDEPNLNPQSPPVPPVQNSSVTSEEFNSRVREAFASIPIPPHLREQILAQQKIISPPFWRTDKGAKTISALALAAALALLVTGLLFWNRAPREDKTFAGFQSRMISFALRQYDMDLRTNQLAAVKTYLAAQGAPADFPLPATLAASAVIGGKSLSWQGKPVGMVCFGHGQEILYMFVIDSKLPCTPTNAAAPPAMATYKNLATATWTTGNKTFLLAGRIPATDLERLVKS
jgi:hypothetical protein